MPISSCDDDRLKFAREVENSFDRARQLAKEGAYEEALKCYLFAFDNSLCVSGWGGVRLSYIPSEIAELGEKYPPAKAALVMRRDAREKLLCEGETDRDVLAEWLSINRYLEEHEREFELLQELRKKKLLNNYVKKRIIDANFERLLEAGDYRVLEEFFDDFGNDFMFQILHYEEARIFQSDFRVNPSKAMDQYWVEHVIEDGAKIFELALGLRKIKIAERIRKRVLRCANSAEAFNRLIKAAVKAGNKQIGKELLEQAKRDLDKSEYAKIDRFVTRGL